MPSQFNLLSIIGPDRPGQILPFFAVHGWQDHAKQAFRQMSAYEAARVM
jgi:hypothetical protein